LNLENYGASERFLLEASLYPELHLARVLSQYRDLYKIVTEEGEALAEVSGKFRYEASSPSDFPAVGDYVMVDRRDAQLGNLIIHHVLTRKSVFERTAVGMEQETQVVAANVDLVFICMSLNKDYNLSRLERYLSIAWNSRAMPVIVLTKSDLCEDLSNALFEVSAVAPGTEILVTSSFDEASYAALSSYLRPGITATLIGSSGVGKSTLINCLCGEEFLPTSAIRADDKGRHTTTRRELFLLPQGGVVIDTPGMRELGVNSADLSKSFLEIEELAASCRFRDCTHTNEPGCAILHGLETGLLDRRRYENYLKLRKEARYEGLSSKQIEAEKIQSMFGGLGEMKKARDYVKEKQKRR